MTDTVDTLKQRVVGAFVIISLAVIFLPMIFDEPHQQESNIIVPVPPRPSFQIKEIDKPARPEFQRLEFNLEAQKVVEEINVSASNQQNFKADVKTTDKINAKELEATKNSVKEEKLKSSRQSRVNTSPKVSHLPVFKNVWMVQLGTFSQTDNAYQLRDQLRKDGFDGHTKKVDLNGRNAIRVFTGPFVDKTEAEKIKIKLDKKYKVESRVMFFDA
ncbi:MAG: DedD protein [Oleiphilaceae bacterium]|jgi:DedD protein